jgi:hypothetical protein
LGGTSDLSVRFMVEIARHGLDLVVQSLLFDVGKNRYESRIALQADGCCRGAAAGMGWKSAKRIVVVVKGQSELLEIVGALRSAGSFPGRWDGRQKQRDQDPDG